jgi:ribose-phosphate pyrophosphokinase
MDKIIVSCSQSLDLAKSVAEKTQTPYLSLNLKTFTCNEYQINFDLKENFNYQNIFLFQGLSDSVNDAIMELIYSLDLIRRLSTYNIYLVLPYLYYARQDKAIDKFTSNNLEVLLNLVAIYNIKEIITIDLHSNKILSKANFQIVNLEPTNIFAKHIQTSFADNLNNITIIAPDEGSIERANLLADILNLPVIFLNKIRTPQGIQFEALAETIDNNRTFILIDDIVDTAETLCKAAELLHKQSAEKIFAYSTHGILAPGAFDSLHRSPIIKLVITNLINRIHPSINSDQIEIINGAEIFVNYILKI